MEMIRRRLPAKALDYLVPRVLLAALDRFSTTTNVQDASGVVHSMCDAEAERTESELSIIRYIAWAIPSIGFIGTVRGIGNALGQVHRAVEGDITGVTQSLGVAFNSTFVALVISIVLMFLIHQVQLMQERLVQDTRRYCDDWLIRRLRS
jgi:biopolymer transport protein ExbB/TolQ